MSSSGQGWEWKDVIEGVSTATRAVSTANDTVYNANATVSNALTIAGLAG